MTDQPRDPVGAEQTAPRLMQVGAVADRLGLSIRTLHHWDEVGLVSPSARSAGGFRLYTDQDVERLTTVRRMKPLGFSLEEMKELLRSLDALTANDSDADTDAARAFIQGCRQRADESCAALRQRLAWAEEFRDLLVSLEPGRPTGAAAAPSG